MTYYVEPGYWTQSYGVEDYSGNGEYVLGIYWQPGYIEGDLYRVMSAEIQSLAPSAVIELFQLDASNQGVASPLYFHAGNSGYMLRSVGAAATAVNVTTNEVVIYNHGLATGNVVRIATTPGDTPMTINGEQLAQDGISASVTRNTRYVIRINENVFLLASTQSRAYQGLSDDIQSAGTGVHTFQTDSTNQPITFQGISYTAFPIEVSGFEYNGRGTLPRPTLRVSNVFSTITALLLQYSDLVGAKLTRVRTLARYLDGQPAANPDAEFPREVYYVDRKVSENRDMVEFELASALDLAGVMLPRRQIIQNTCPWVYRSAECGYTGTAYFNANDQSVGSSALDVCGKRLSSCKARFGQYAELPFGGFPSAGLIRA